MIEDIQTELKDIEQHMDNIKELISGVSEQFAEDILMAVSQASASLEEAHNLLLPGACPI